MVGNLTLLLQVDAMQIIPSITSFTQQFMRVSFCRSLQVAILVTAVFFFSKQSMHAEYPFAVEVTGQGQPLLLVPGLACSGTVWQDAVQTLSETHQCHVLTLPGFAGQPAVEHEGKYVDFIKNEINRYIDELGLQHPVVIGHSLGGFLGLLMASEPESRLAGLIVVDSLPFLSAMMNPAATEESAKAMAQGMVQQAQTMQPAQYRQMLSTMITAPERVEEALEWSGKSDGATVSQAMLDLYTTDLRDDVSSIRIPVLVMGAWVAYKNYGATRESTMSIYQAQYAALPNFELKMTDIGKHFIMWDDPEFFMKETTAYLAR